MDSFELNKIMGAVLGTCLVLLVMNITADAIFAPVLPEKPGFEVAVEEADTSGAKKEEVAAVPIETLLAASSAERGATAAKKCAACHTFEKGGPNRVGPNLYGVVGADKGHHAGFNYSAAMKSKGGKWTFAELNEFIHHPKKHIPGTSMGFAGISRDSERADVINYLHTLSDNPEPLPTAAAAPEPAAPAPAAPEPAAPAAAPAQ